MTKQRNEAKTSLALLRLSKPRYSKFIKGRLEKNGFNISGYPVLWLFFDSLAYRYSFLNELAYLLA